MRSKLGKKVITLLLFCMSIVMLPNSVAKAETLKEGDYEYEILEDGTAMITKYTGTAVTLNIPDTLGGKKVTKIADLAFEVPVEVEPGSGYYVDQSTVTKVTFPDTLTYIGDGNFYQLTSIHIPKNVTYIGSRAFGTEHVESITVDEENPVYDSRNNCNAIIQEEISGYTGKKEVELVRGCDNTVIPDDVTCIGADAFSNYSKESIVIPNGVKVIGYCAFLGSNLTELNLPDSVTTIGSCAFYNCNGLKNVVLPDNVKEIYEWAFGACENLTSIYIPNGVTTIGYAAFEDCSSLKSVAIPSSVEYIEGGTFAGCSSLKSVVIPSSVEEIAGDEDDVRGAFADCPSDMTIYVEAGSYAEEWAKENGYQISYDKPEDNPNQEPSTGQPSTGQPSTEQISPEQTSTEQTTTEQTTVENSVAKKPAAKGTTLTVASTKCKVKVVSSDEKNPTVQYTGTTNKKATTVKVPDTVTVDDIQYKVTSVSNKALSGNKKVKKVVIGKNVTTIGKEAFKNCTNLKTVESKSTTLNKIGAGAFSGDKKLTKITLKTTKLTKKSVGKNALKGTNKKLVIKVPKSKVSAYKKYFKNKGNKTVQVKK